MPNNESRSGLPGMADYVTVHNIAVLTLGITAVALAGKGAAKAMEVTAEMLQDREAFKREFFARTNAAASEGTLADFKMPIIMKHPHYGLERAVAFSLCNFYPGNKKDLGDILRTYGVSSVTARPLREKIGRTEDEHLWVRFLTDPKAAKGERRSYYEIVGGGALYDGPCAPPFPIRGSLEF